MASSGANHNLRRDETGISPLRKELETSLKKAKRNYRKIANESHTDSSISLKYGICLGLIRAITIIEHYEEELTDENSEIVCKYCWNSESEGHLKNCITDLFIVKTKRTPRAGDLL